MKNELSQRNYNVTVTVKDYEQIYNKLHNFKKIINSSIQRFQYKLQNKTNFGNYNTINISL